MKKIPASTIVPWATAVFFYLLSFSFFQDGDIKSFAVYVVYSTALLFLGWKVKGFFILASISWTFSPLCLISGVSALRSGSIIGCIVGTLLGAVVGLAGWALRYGKERPDILRAIGVENPDMVLLNEENHDTTTTNVPLSQTTGKSSWPQPLKIGIIVFVGIVLISAIPDTNSNEEANASLTETSVQTTTITAQKVTTTQVATTPTTTTIPATTTVQTTITQATTTTQTTTVTKPVTTRSVPQATNSQTVYVTRTGKKYHYSSTCNDGTYFASTYDEATSRGLQACDKCVG